MIRTGPLLVGCWLLWLLCGVASAAVLDMSQPGRWQTELDVLEDASGLLTAEQALTASFRPRSPVRTGHDGHVFWLRLQLLNPSSEPVTRWLQVDPARLQRLDFHQFDSSQGRQAGHSGARVPIEQRVLNHRQLLWPVTLAPDTAATVLVRVQHSGRASLNVRLWEPQVFLQHERRLDFFNALQFGAMLWLALFALLAFAMSRLVDFLLLSLLTLVGVMGEITYLQYGQHYLWPGAEGWNHQATLLFGGLVMPLAGLLMTRLLRMHRHAPFGHRLIRLLSLGLLLLVVCRTLGYHGSLIMLSAPASVILMLGLAVWSVRLAWRGTPGARLWLTAFALIWMGALYGAGRVFGWWMLPQINGLSIVWVLLVSLALMILILTHKIRQFREERARALDEASEARLESRLQQLRTRELQLERDAAERASQAKSTFLAHLSHELRTPLHSILGYSGLILDELEPEGDELGRRVGAIQRSGRHLLDLIDDLLDYARGEAGRLALQCRPMDLEELLGSVVEEMRPLARSCGATLTLDLTPLQVRYVEGDRVRLRQVLINLISNGCRHSGASTIQVQGGSDWDQGRVRVTLVVADDGQGIAVADQERIFHPFEQASGQASQGMGLGLPIARQWVALMGGDLRCDSTPGAGCRFSFAVLLTAGTAPAPVAVSPPVGRHSGRLPRVLVVDDLGENRLLLSDALGVAGFAVTLADGVEKAMQCLLETPFDVVMTDQRMPDGSGWTLLQRARAAGHHMPWVLLSAARPAPPEYWDGPAFDLMLLKPVRMVELVEHLRRLVGQGTQTLARSGTVEPRPDAGTLEPLRRAVSAGAISDIEDWVRATRAAQPQSEAFLQQVLAATRRMDLSALRALLDEEG